MKLCKRGRRIIYKKMEGNVEEKEEEEVRTENGRCKKGGEKRAVQKWRIIINGLKRKK